MRRLSLGRDWRRMTMLLMVAAVVVALVFSLVASTFVNAAIAFRAAVGGNNGAGGTTVSVAMPTGVVSGDVMIAVISVRGGSNATISTVPTGWTFINSSDSGTALKSATYYKVAGGSEAGPYVWGWGATSRLASGVISAYSGVDNASPIAAQDSQANTSSTTMTAPSITTTLPNSWVIAAYSTATGTTVSAGSSMNLRGQAASTGGLASTRTTTGLQDILQGSAGASGTKTMTAGLSAVNVGHTIALKPLQPTFTQSAYRWYANANSVTPGASLAAENTSASVTVGTNVRLRTQLDVSTADFAASTQAFRLEYATSTSGPWTSLGSSSTWWNSSWLRRIKITFDNSASTDNLVNFPVRVSLNSGNIDYTKTDDQGRDLRFVDPDGTVLNYEREQWNESGTSEVWVNVPQIDAGSTTDYIYLYYYYMGGGSTPADGENVAGTWNSSYRGVWHTKEGSGTSVADSTSNSNTGTLQNGAAITTSGKIGNANTFDGTDDIMNAGSAASLDDLYTQGGGGMTVTAWVNSVDSGNWSEVAIKAQSAAPANGWLLEVDDANDNLNASITYGASNLSRYTGGVSSLYGTWAYYGMTYDNSFTSEGINMYKNGVLENYGGGAGSVGGTDSDASYALTSGCDLPLDPNECLQGSIDELRVSNVIRSPSWIRAEYISGNNAMNSFGAAEVYSPSVPIGWYDNATPSDGAAISISVLTGTDVLETYEEGNATAINPNAVSVGQQAEWDFSLTTAGVTPGTYYFRLAKSDGTALGSYTVYPALVINGVVPTLDQQMRGGGSVIDGAKGNLIW